MASSRPSISKNCIDPAKPGTNVAQCYYSYENGTSMAAPHVSAALALLKAKFPGAVPSDLRAKLLQPVMPRTELQCSGKCSSYPGGDADRGLAGHVFPAMRRQDAESCERTGSLGVSPDGGTCCLTQITALLRISARLPVLRRGRMAVVDVQGAAARRRPLQGRRSARRGRAWRCRRRHWRRCR